mmetsp:Transcript_8442/g.30018  ORF Transcript_8442/g.30018 Transcript_8442/m.30018 type:complete len:213 (-) Transcript_8442:19-657(-)
MCSSSARRSRAASRRTRATASGATRAGSSRSCSRSSSSTQTFRSRRAPTRAPSARSPSAPSPSRPARPSTRGCPSARARSTCEACSCRLNPPAAPPRRRCTPAPAELRVAQHTRQRGRRRTHPACTRREATRPRRRTAGAGAAPPAAAVGRPATHQQVARRLRSTELRVAVTARTLPQGPRPAATPPPAGTPRRAATRMAAGAACDDVSSDR